MENELKGKVQTVLGLVEPTRLGFTLPHEHLFIDVRGNFVEPSDVRHKKHMNEPVNFENLYWVRNNRLYSRDNLVLDNERTAIKEVLLFKEIGGSTIVEVTPNNCGRNPVGMLNVARATGLNIIMGTAYYTESNMGPETDSMTEVNFADEFIKDITIGVGKEHIKAGIIGEVGCSWPLGKKEKKVLRAAALAQQKTGAAISIHPGFNEKAPFEIVDILTDAGAKPERIVIGHITLAFPSEAHTIRVELAKRGCYLAWDQFGINGIYPLEPSPYNIANEVTSIDEIINLVGEGYLDRILISHDTGNKILLSSYGGSGFLLIPEVIIPLMLNRGLTQDQIQTLTIENPRRALTFS